MDIKGVQLESLGYLSLCHALKWSNFTQFKVYESKLLKYLGNNAYDLALAKVAGLNDNNFGQVENFIEYEAFLANSHYMTVVNEFAMRAKTALN